MFPVSEPRFPALGWQCQAELRREWVLSWKWVLGWKS
jgi:hypothetical protein